MEIEGRVGVVTGAGSGIGLGIAEALARAGMKVVLADIERPPLDAAVARLRAEGLDVAGVPVDVTDADSMRRLAEATLDRYAAVHLLCGNAGVSMAAPIAETTVADWEWLLAVNLWGPIHGIRTFLPLIERQDAGYLITTASMAGLYATATMGAYSATKHAAVALMAALERDLRLAGSRVRAAVLCPFFVRTNIADAERNRPAHLRAAARSDRGERHWRRVGRAVADGMSPRDVGLAVRDAVTADRFWIIPEPAGLDPVEQQFTAMRADRTLRP